MSKNPAPPEALPESTRNPVEGLTPEQERAAALLASGKSIPAVADDLGRDRTTVWRWTQLETFQAALNVLLDEAKGHARHGLLALVERALTTVSGALDSTNDAVRLRAALAVLDRASAVEVGPDDARSLVRKRVRAEIGSDLDDLLSSLDPNAEKRETAYRAACEALGLDTDGA